MILSAPIRPATRPIWVSIKDYFREHPEQRASRRILFDREHDRFDARADSALWKLARPRVDGLHLGTPPIHETLVSNLLPVESIPDPYLHAPRRRSAAVATPARCGATRLGEWPRDWIVWAGQIYSFTDPGDGLLSKLCTGPVESFATSEWADADDEESAPPLRVAAQGRAVGARCARRCASATT